MRLLAAFFPLLALGCSPVRVQVDCRVSADSQLRERLAGPRYVIRGPDEPTEASLAFQEFSNTLAATLEMRHPDLRRVGVTDTAEFAILLQAGVTDLGAGVVSSPVYGHYHGCAYGPYGPGHYSSFGVVGTRMHAVHLGFRHTLMVSAYILDPDGPDGRRVLWEGAAGTIADQADMAGAVPYLALALTSFWGESTEGPRSLRYTEHSDEVEMLNAWLRTSGPPTSQPSEGPEPAR